jgi:hypothetical protein
VRNLSDCSTRRGVSRSPSRVGSSPISASNSRIVSRIFAFYLAAAALVVAPVGATQDDPDTLYRQREDIASARRATDIWAARAARGNDFESAWKLARSYYWLGTHGTEAERRAALDRGVKAGEQAIALDGSKPEGHFWMAANMGTLAESYGLIQGIKYRGRIREALERVLAINPGWQQGSADRALGWWYFKVPGLFGGSTRQAEAHIRKSLTYNPQSTVSLYFLAEVLLDARRTAEARTLLQQVLDAPLDPEWGPEDKDFKQKARDRLRTLPAK